MTHKNAADILSNLFDRISQTLTEQEKLAVMLSLDVLKEGRVAGDAGRNYPTRMHELCQMEPMEVAAFEMLDNMVNTVKFKFYLNFKGVPILSPDGKVLDTERFVEIINHPERIIRRPRLTEEQLYALEASVKVFDAKWLAKDATGSVFLYESKPERGKGIWMYGGQAIRVYFSKFYDLVSWSDPEPLDIMQTLRDAGVDVGVADHD